MRAKKRERKKREKIKRRERERKRESGIIQRREEAGSQVVSTSRTPCLELVRRPTRPQALVPSVIGPAHTEVLLKVVPFSVSRPAYIEVQYFARS